MHTIHIPKGVEVTVRPHESEAGKHKWRIRGVGIIQRAGVADSCVEATEAAASAVIAKPVLVKGV